MHLKFFFRFLYQIITQSNRTVIQNKKIIAQLRMQRKQIKKQDIAMRPHATGVIVT